MVKVKVKERVEAVLHVGSSARSVRERTMIN
jgi:hypothetical protein